MQFFFFTSLQANIKMGNMLVLNTKYFSVHFINGLENPEDKLTIS